MGCSPEFRAASDHTPGGSPSHVGAGGEGDVPKGEAGEAAGPAQASGGEGGDGVSPGGSSVGGSAGSEAGGSAGNAGAGSGGVGPDEEGCQVPVGEAPVLFEKFPTDVFDGPAWSRSNSSVMVDGQQLLISQDQGLDDYADVQLADGQLPLVVQVKAMMLTNGQAHKWPVVDLLPAAAAGDGRVTITFQAGVNAGWQFTKQDDFSGSFVNTPQTATFMTVRAFISATGGVLCAKSDAQPGFVKVAAAQWDFGAVHKIRLRQAWDEMCRFDDLILYR